MANQKSQTFVFGAFILMFSNILVKVIGAILKIPLTNIIGSEGMAYYNAAASIYVSFYMISTAGIPVAISRMIATCSSQGNKREIKKIFRVSFIVFAVIGVLGTAIMMIFARNFARAAKLDASVYAMLVIAPTLFFICLSSAYRGYFQGLQNMVPTAISQVIEALGKLSIGLFAGGYFISLGYEVHIVAAYVISGITIGVIASTVYLAISKAMFSASSRNEPIPDMSVRSYKSIFRELVIISIPISLSASIMGLTNVVDTMLVTRRLAEAGIAESVAVKLYGAYTSMPVTLFNMPTTLIYPFAISALPALAAIYAKKDKAKANSTMEATFRITAMIAVPCALGLSALSYPILSMLYRKEIVYDNVSSVEAVSPSLSILALAIFFVGLIAITNSMLQAFHMQNKTIISTAFGIVVKAVSAYILLGIPNISINAAAISTVMCYFTIMAVNLFYVVKTVNYFPSFRKVFLKPLSAGMICALIALSVYRLSIFLLSNSISTLLAMMCAVVSYIYLLVAFKGLAEDDIMLLPKGEKLCELLKKLHILENK